MRQILTCLFTVVSTISFSQSMPNAANEVIDKLPVRGFCIAAPQTREVDAFVRFIDEELAPRTVTDIMNVRIRLLYILP